jgi:hypothetical protein
VIIETNSGLLDREKKAALISSIAIRQAASASSERTKIIKRFTNTPAAHFLVQIACIVQI